MTQETLEKIRRGVKIDISLHELYWETRREREAMGLPLPENEISDPETTIAEWHHEQGMTPPRARPLRKKAKRRVQEFEIIITLAPQHGYWVYCPAVNGKRMHGETVMEAQKKMTAYLADYLGKLAAQGKALPKTSVRIKKLKITAPALE